MAKEKNYSKRLQEIQQSNPATLPKRFVDMERQRDKFKKEAEQYLEARNKAEHEKNEARREISRLKLQLQYYGQKPLQLEVAHYERYCEGCKHYNDGVYCSAQDNYWGEECNYRYKQETVYCFCYELQEDELTVLTSDFEWKTFSECEEIVSQGKVIYEDKAKDGA